MTDTKTHHPVHVNQEGIEEPTFTEMNDLVSERVGGKICFATDDWFAAAENLIKPTKAIWKENEFTEFGKWMDGWETRRKRIPGHDYCIIQLGASGLIHGVEVDTSFFTGNHCPQMSIQAACLEEDFPKRDGDRMGTKASQKEFQQIADLKAEEWTEILPRSKLGAGYHTTAVNYFAIRSRERWTHVKLNMFPDGGIARFRVYGQVVPDWSLIAPSQVIDLAAMTNGGICIGYTDAHYGHARNLIAPDRAKIMAEGWETARQLDRHAILEADENGVLQLQGEEWAEFKLGATGVVEMIEVDTNHFKGNYPDSCYIQGCYVDDDTNENPVKNWKTILPVQKLSPHERHMYDHYVIDIGPINYWRIVIAPDGGVSRVRLFGHRKFELKGGSESDCGNHSDGSDKSR